MTAEPTANPSVIISDWTADQASCPPLTLQNISALTQLAQIGRGEPHNAAWSPDGETIALSSATGVHLFDGHTLQWIGTLPSGYTTVIAWSPDGSLLALCSTQSAGNDKNPMNLSLSAGGSTVFGAGMSELCLWTAKGKLLYSASIEYPCTLLRAAYGSAATGADFCSWITGR